MREVSTCTSVCVCVCVFQNNSLQLLPWYLVIKHGDNHSLQHSPRMRGLGHAQAGTQDTSKLHAQAGVGVGGGGKVGGGRGQ